MAINSFMVPLGTPAPDFSLPAVDGRPVALGCGIKWKPGNETP